MNKLKDREALFELQNEEKERMKGETCRILICAGTGCLAGGSDKIYEKMCKLTSENENVAVEFGEEIAHKDEEYALVIRSAYEKAAAMVFVRWGR